MKPYGKNAGAIIREHRKAKGWSQADLAHVLGYSDGGQFISNSERNKNNFPPKAFWKVCQELSINPDTLRAAMIRDLVACLEYDIEKGKENDSQLVGRARIQESDNRTLLQ